MIGVKIKKVRKKMKQLNKLFVLLIIGIIVLPVILAVDYTDSDEVNALSDQDLGDAIQSGKVDTSVVTTEKLTQVYENYRQGDEELLLEFSLKDEDLIRLIKYKPSLIHLSNAKFAHPEDSYSPMYRRLTELMTGRDYRNLKPVTDEVRSEILSVLNGNIEVKKEYFRFMGAEIDDGAVVEEVTLKLEYPDGLKDEIRVHQIKGPKAVKFQLDVDNPKMLEGVSFKEDGSAVIQSTGAEISNALIGREFDVSANPPYASFTKDLEEIHQKKIEKGDLYILGGKIKIGDKEYSKELDPAYEKGYYYKESVSGIIGKDVFIKDSETGETTAKFNGFVKIDQGKRTVLTEETKYTRYENDEESVTYNTNDGVVALLSDQDPLLDYTNIKEGEDLIQIDNIGKTNLEVTFHKDTDKEVVINYEKIEGDSQEQGNVIIKNEEGDSLSIGPRGKVRGRGEYYKLPTIENNFQGKDGELHSIKITSTSGSSSSLSVCSDCKEVGQAFKRLDKHLKDNTENILGQRLRLNPSTIITEAYVTKDNMEVYRAFDIKTLKTETYVVDVDNGIVVYSEGENKFQQASVDSDGNVQLSDVSMGPVTTTLIKEERAAAKTGVIPSKGFSIAPKVDVKMIDSWSYLIGENLEAGDVYLRDNRIKSPGFHYAFVYDPEKGNWKGLYQGISKGDTLTPEQFDELMNRPEISARVVPYEYSGHIDTKAGIGTLKIKDSRGTNVGSIKLEGPNGFFAKYNLYGPTGKKIGVYSSLLDSKKAFEGKALHEWYSRRKLESFGEGFFDDIQRARQ